MTNITPLYWEASGGSLHTHAWAIKTRGGNRYSTAGKRGNDLEVPFSPGEQNTRKLRDARYINLPMWIQPINPDGSMDGSLSSEQKMFANWEYLLGLMDVDGQFPLVKRMYDPSDGTAVITATAYAELIDAPEPSIIALDTMEADFEVKLADPWFYKPNAAVAIGGVVIEGNAPTNHLTVVFTGGTNPRITTPDGNWVQYQGTPATPVTLDIKSGMATQGGNYVNGLIVRNPEFPSLPVALPGDSIALSGGGSATLSYESAWR